MPFSCSVGGWDPLAILSVQDSSLVPHRQGYGLQWCILAIRSVMGNGEGGGRDTFSIIKK